jgi:hypothetical protein
MGVPGPAEIVVIIVMLVLLFGLPLIGLLIAFVVIALSKGKPAAPQAGPACESCGGWTVPQANYCQWCGKPLATAPTTGEG